MSGTSIASSEHVADYYHDVSYGQLVVESTVHDQVVKLPRDMGYYGDDDLFSERGTELIWNAVTGADDDVNFGDYTGLAIIHSGPGQETDINRDSEEQIWSAFFPANLLAFVLEDTLGVVPGIPTNDLDESGETVYVQGAALLPETETQDGWRFGLMGVYTHELGHVIVGWPDLYDTTPDSPSQGSGAFCLMAAGTWNGNGFVPGEPNVWSRYYAGWLDPVTNDDAPDGGRLVNLSYIQEDAPSPDDTLAVRVPISADEYFLIAARQPDPNDNARFDWNRRDENDVAFNFWQDSFVGSEFDYFTPNLIPAAPTNEYREAEGLYIWHIDDSVVRFGFPFNIVNGDPHHMGIDLEEADGLQDLEYDAFSILSFGSPDDAWRPGTAVEFGPDTEPSTAASFGAPSRIRIHDIGTPGEDGISFRISFVEGSEAASVVSGFPVTLPALAADTQPVAQDLDGDGTPEFALAGEMGELILLDVDGNRVDGGIGLDEAPAASPIIADVDDDGAPEVVMLGRGGELSTFALAGAATREATVMLDSVRAGGLTVAAGQVLVTTDDPGVDSLDVPLELIDFANGGTRTTIRTPGAAYGAPAATDRWAVVSGRFGGLWTIDLNGDADQRDRAIFEPSVAFGPATIALLGGEQRIVVHAGDGQLASLRLDADTGALSMVEGWPVAVGGPSRGAVSVGDVNADGFAEILVAGTSGSIHVLNHNGVPLAGFPKSFDVPLDTFFDLSAPHPAPLAADVDGDGGLDLIPVFADGRTFALEAAPGDARTLRGWPLQAGAATVPIVGDFDGDGRTDVFTIERGLGSREDDVLPTRAVRWALDSPYRSHPAQWTMYRGAPDGNPVRSTTGSSVPTDVAAVSEVYCQPNPARADGTRFHYRLAADVTDVRITIYDAAGAEVRQLTGTAFGGVNNLVAWDGRTEGGAAAAPGLYVYRVEARGASGTEVELGKLALVR